MWVGIRGRGYRVLCKRKTKVADLVVGEVEGGEDRTH